MTHINTGSYYDPSVRISSLKGAPAGIISAKQYSEEDILAVVTGKRALEPKEELAMLSQMVTKELPKEIAQLFKGQKFSLVAEKLSARLQLPYKKPVGDRSEVCETALSTPREVMAALLIGSKGLSTLSIKGLYAAGREFSMNLSDMCELLMTLQQGNAPVPLEDLGIALEYKKENPEKVLDTDKLKAYVADAKKLLDARSVGQVIEDTLEDDKEVKTVNPDDFARLRIFVYDAKIPKMNFGHATVHEVTQQVYAQTEELNKKLERASVNEKKVADVKRGLKDLEKEATEKVSDGITLLKKTSAYIGLQSDTPAMDMKKSDIRMQALHEKQRKESLRTSLGGVAMVV